MKHNGRRLFITNFQNSSAVNLSDEFRDGRPSTAVNNKNIDAVRRVIETERHVTYHEMASVALEHYRTVDSNWYTTVYLPEVIDELRKNNHKSEHAPKSSTRLGIRTIKAGATLVPDDDVTFFDTARPPAPCRDVIGARTNEKKIKFESLLCLCNLNGTAEKKEEKESRGTKEDKETGNREKRPPSAGVVPSSTE
ncbi:hypothetical protein EVAR_54477_1 [Eumeta japonica]|uniref:Uncharacterized protein n=1 Tax=Eumeta variegata TaxID=151549 RepID=A0A4C1YXI6_EUMVA|nr:hypothetical protein EVAR_54477_1 [Eumeta japonica]